MGLLVKENHDMDIDSIGEKLRRLEQQIVIFEV